MAAILRAPHGAPARSAPALSLSVASADTSHVSENVDRRLVEHWQAERARRAEELRFRVALEREGYTHVPEDSLFADQLAVLRERVARQRTAACDDRPWDEPA